ncbi:unnamed protein product [Sphenostylis stenocarpa]|uniref:TIR domain-containing protein n=1 Tax=Sphenostylis stenocarpa TaxID=92480 RepID=A0AA86TKL9_9FABA|nr:unnamed protein product [Sphenostylis stenocarpa]
METIHDEEESLGFIYDVFLSFRDEDTSSHTFIKHLCKELLRKGIYTYFDDKHVRVTNPIEESKILIIVFSEHYASSTRCLDELVKILESTKRDKKQVVFPIFYFVDPSDVRHQRNSYGKHMMAHQNEFGKDSQKVKDWRSALATACNLPGEAIYTAGRGYEINFIEKIVMRVYKNITPKPLHTGLNLVGLRPRVEEVKSRLDMKSDDRTVRMLGIWGLGGVGKTELAKSLYNKIVHHFDAASFLAHVRAKSSQINGLKDLQKTLLLDMLKELDNELDNTTCFFKGEKIEYVEQVLGEFGTTSNINTLVNRSLLTTEDGYLKMHPLIQDMGREIVRQEAPNYPGERSRLWIYDDVIEILTENSGSYKIQGIMLDPPQREKVCWSGTAFKKMKWLRILIVRNTSFSPEPQYLPNHLRVLDWEEYPSKSFPSSFHPKKIIVFNWPRSHLILEEPFKVQCIR